MKSLQMTFKPRTIPLDDSWDVIVVGGGPAGCAAATAAARDGARTLLVEATGCLGGMGTSGLVASWCPLSYAGKEGVAYGGLAANVFWASKAGVPHSPPDQYAWVPINPEHLKRVYDDLVAGAGATVLFHTMLAAVESEEGAVSSLILCNKSGLTAYRAKVYVDCTGDGDLAAWAGAESAKGADGTGDMQPVSLNCAVSNVDCTGHCTDLPRTAIPTGTYPLLPPELKAGGRIIGSGTVVCGGGHQWDVDGTDPRQLSEALIRGRRMAAQLHAASGKLQPAAFGNSFLVSTATLMGVRETRRIIGDYVLTLADFLAVRTFPDEICRNCFSIDIHVSRQESDEIARNGGDVHHTSLTKYHRLPAGSSYGIPYRCLSPKGLRNVLVAGRCISTDRMVQGSIRSMLCCLATGEGAGTAAVLAAGMGNPDVHSVDVQQLRSRLRAKGAFLPDVAAASPLNPEPTACPSGAVT